MTFVPSGNAAFDAVVLKAEKACQIALTVAGLTPAQATAATKAYLEAVITGGVLHGISMTEESKSKS